MKAEYIVISVRVEKETLERLDKAVDRANELDLGFTTSRSGWVAAVIEEALDQDEAKPVHVPAIVKDAEIQRRGSRIIMPAGRTLPMR